MQDWLKEHATCPFCRTPDFSFAPNRALIGLLEKIFPNENRADSVHITPPRPRIKEYVRDWIRVCNRVAREKKRKKRKEREEREELEQLTEASLHQNQQSNQSERSTSTNAQIVEYSTTNHSFPNATHEQQNNSNERNSDDKIERYDEGTVVDYFRMKSYGFIRGNNNKLYHFHLRNASRQTWERDLWPEQKVRFIVSYTSQA